MNKHQSGGENFRLIQEREQHQIQHPFLAKLKAIHQALLTSGYRFRTRAEIDAQINEERESWEKQKGG